MFIVFNNAASSLVFFLYVYHKDDWMEITIKSPLSVSTRGFNNLTFSLRPSVLIRLHSHSHTTHTRRHWGHSTASALIFGLIGDHALRGQQQG